MIAVDTNILFYAHDSRDQEKQRKAADLIASLYEDGALLWQVACEYLWSSRRLASMGYSYADALADVRVLQRVWKTALPTWRVIDRSEALRVSYMLSHWDALLIGACLEAGVNHLFSEDFGDNVRIETLEITNPFR